MTREDILSMKPGRELDALVAEKVMEWIEVECFGIKDNKIKRPPVSGCQTIIARGWNQQIKMYATLPNYSTDISAAWEIVNKKQTFPYSISKCNNGKWSINWCSSNYECMNCDEECTGKFEVEADTAPEATCKAALLASLEV